MRAYLSNHVDLIEKRLETSLDLPLYMKGYDENESIIILFYLLSYSSSNSNLNLVLAFLNPFLHP